MGARMVTPRRARQPSSWKAIERLDASPPENREFLGIDERDCVELFAEDAVDRLAVIVERVLRRREVDILDAHVFSLSWDDTSSFDRTRSAAISGLRRSTKDYAEQVQADDEHERDDSEPEPH